MRINTFGTRLMLEEAQGKITPLPGKTFINKLTETINQTKLEIFIMQYQWNFYTTKPDSPIQRLNQCLINRANSGLKVKVLLNKEGRGAHLTAINMEASKYLKEANINVKFGRTFPITHAKLWIFDYDSVILGSHNLSNRSVSVNNETSALIKSREVAMEFRRYFDLLWKLS